MFEELRQALSEIQMPPISKAVVLILSRVMEWIIWVFIGVGILLNKEYFQIWFVFVLVVFSSLIILLIYTLLRIVRWETTRVIERESGQNEKITPIIDKAISGIIGSVAFYTVILVVFIVFKTMGIFDQLLSKIFDFLK